MKETRARAKSLILHWCDKRSYPATARKAVGRDIDRFFDELHLRQDWCECITTLLDGSESVEFTIKGPGWQARPTGRGLAVSSIVPGWGFGWSGVLQDEDATSLLSGIGHYARQYIHRANIAKVIMVVWERQNLVLRPLSSAMLFKRYSDINPRPSRMKDIFYTNERDSFSLWGMPILQKLHSVRSKWCARNTLDPAIHQAIFHFLRGQSLLSSGFDLESLVAFDCVLHALQSMKFAGAAGDPRRNRTDLCRALGLGRSSADLAEHVYFLRNQFVAHAGGWRWWDTGDYFEDDLASHISKLTLRALRRAADLEPNCQSIDPAPINWAMWFEAYFPLLWSAFWFRDP